MSGTTVTMDDYTYGMIYARVKPAFDAWLRETGIATMSCFELTFSEGTCLLRCYVKDSDNHLVLRPDAPKGWRTSTTPEYSVFDYVEVVEQEVVPSVEPPVSVLQYLSARECE